MNRRWIKRWNRYWLHEEKKAKNAIDSCGLSNGWFDFWHTHPDWKSRGNSRYEQRVYVARITYSLLVYTDNLLRQMRPGRDIQSFATICEDTGSNAVCLHTVNPNKTPFPHKFEGTIWNEGDIPGLEGIVDLHAYEIGVYSHDEHQFFYIRKRI